MTIEPQPATSIPLTASRIWRNTPPDHAGRAMLQGFLGRCPSCGKGRMFRAFLKVADCCPHCGEELHHHRADDFPAYLVIVLVGHLIVPQIYEVETTFSPPLWVHFSIWLPLTALLALLLIQPVKGAVVALQWAGGMHGFEMAKKTRDLAAGLVPATGARMPGVPRRADAENVPSATSRGNRSA